VGLRAVINIFLFCYCPLLNVNLCLVSTQNCSCTPLVIFIPFFFLCCFSPLCRCHISVSLDFYFYFFDKKIKAVEFTL
jgi:hypothetical protein